VRILEYRSAGSLLVGVCPDSVINAVRIVK
jgi:hypothetical protein